MAAAAAAPRTARFCKYGGAGNGAGDGIGNGAGDGTGSGRRGDRGCRCGVFQREGEHGGVQVHQPEKVDTGRKFGFGERCGDKQRNKRGIKNGGKEHNNKDFGTGGK